MGRKATVMTPERQAEARALRDEGLSLNGAAARMGVNPCALGRWARKNDCRFTDGRSLPRTEERLELMRRIGTANLKRLAVQRTMPLSPEERQQYDRIRRYGVGLVTRDDALRAIGRHDLVGAC